jgi:small-conductance mechanosensitive channel
MSAVSTLPIWQNSLMSWSTAFGVTLALLVVLLFARRFARRWHKRLLATEEREVFEVPAQVVGRTTLPFLIVISLFVGLRTLEASAGTRALLASVTTIALFWQAGVWLSTAVTCWIEGRRHAGQADEKALLGSMAIIGLVARTVIWSLVLLLTLDNLGVDITALVAGLGIGGVAVALAVQNVLGDLFASLSIALDRPFVIGDFLAVGDFLGSVEYIGIKSTRLRSLSGEQIVVANADLLGSRIRNYGRMAQRRIAFTLNITYETAADVLEQIPQLIRRIVEAQKDARFDRSHFASYGAHSLDFETVYYVLSADYNRYMDVQQSINLAIYREFERRGIEFAYPTQKLYVVGRADEETGRGRPAAACA